MPIATAPDVYRLPQPRPVYVSGMGETLEDTPFWDIQSKLQTIRAELDELEAAIHDDSELARMVGRQVIEAEQSYGDAVSRWQAVYTAVMGEPDSTLSGLGAWVIAPALAAAIIAVAATVATLAVVVYGLYGTYTRYQQNKDAIAHGLDPSKVPDPTGSAPGSFGDFLKKNGAALLFGGVVIFGLNAVPKR